MTLQELEALDAELELEGGWYDKDGPRVSRRVVSGGRITSDRYGSVVVERMKLVPCEQCGSPVMPTTKVHAPQLRFVGGEWRIVDCSGRWFLQTKDRNGDYERDLSQEPRS